MMRQGPRNLRLFFYLWTSLFAISACSAEKSIQSPRDRILSVLTEAMASKDTGAIIQIVDRTYHDDIGGPGRLEDDLRRIFSVYGKIEFKAEQRSKIDESTFQISYTLVGRRLSFQGPMIVRFVVTPQGPLLTSGLLTDMRAVLNVLRLRRMALEHGSVDTMDSIISMHYKPQQGSRQQLLSQIQEILSSQGRVGIVVRNLKISIDKGEAKVVQSLVKLEIEDTETREKKFDEHIVLHKEGTRWRIVKGLG